MEVLACMTRYQALQRLRDFTAAYPSSPLVKVCIQGLSCDTAYYGGGMGCSFGGFFGAFEDLAFGRPDVHPTKAGTFLDRLFLPTRKTSVIMRLAKE